MTPEEIAENVVKRLTRCSLCGGHDDHEVCEVNWSALEDWIAGTEARFVSMHKRLKELENAAQRSRPGADIDLSGPTSLTPDIL